MKKEAVSARNEYMRQWRAKNRDKVKAINERYWNKKAAEADQQKNKTPEEEEK